MPYRVIASGQSVDGTTINFVALTNSTTKHGAGEYLKWVLEHGPRIKWLVEKELFKSYDVVSVIFTIDRE